MDKRLLDIVEAKTQVEHWHGAGECVVFTNGHFDLLHVGHLHYLETARAQGDRLVVGLNSDESTRLRKGPSRPVIPQEERATLLGALRCVDAVVIFESEDCTELVDTIRPDVYVKGADWNRPGGPRPPEAEVVESYGGRVAYIDLVAGRSTTSIISTILRAADQGSAPGQPS